MNQQIHTFFSQETALNEFLKLYEIQNIVKPLNSTQRGMKPKKDRICRFCAASNESSTFRNDAHLIPNFLGNKHLVSDFECDKCNMLFSTFENDFANWLGISRSIHGTIGKKGKSKYKSTDGVNANPNFTENSQDKYNVLLNSDKSFIEFDSETSKNTINYKKQPYIPINVYKSLLKIALSIIPETEAPNYIYTIKNLITSTKENILTQFAQFIHCTGLPIYQNEEKLACYLFSRKDITEKAPFHIFTIHYENIFISIPIPLHLGDCKNGLYNSGINFMFPPPIYLSPLTQDQPLQTKMTNLSSTEKNTNDYGYIEFQTPTINQDLMYYDPKTGKSGKADFKPEEIRGVLIVDANKKLTMEELQQLADKAVGKQSK
ncbi:hypothetical protein LZF95_04295 [Algoriphagus sp. AGSA1]|uniref:HNH endonuclease n=1 Tax=Algoriphagus sp. AGSA1 TaxID=2907213 RepID=UPI001F326A57|nr:HNH endonuclease [Algoriphagus sp. AGSA1]MCE7053888.1 hypothetical protein [Algoriphagus sp. AGSA1]